MVVAFLFYAVVWVEGCADVCAFLFDDAAFYKRFVSLAAVGRLSYSTINKRWRYKS